LKCPLQRCQGLFSNHVVREARGTFSPWTCFFSYYYLLFPKHPNQGFPVLGAQDCIEILLITFYQFGVHLNSPIGFKLLFKSSYKAFLFSRQLLPRNCPQVKIPENLAVLVHTKIMVPLLSFSGSSCWRVPEILTWGTACRVVTSTPEVMDEGLLEHRNLCKRNWGGTSSRLAPQISVPHGFYWVQQMAKKYFCEQSMLYHWH
jgi:hypothetical protein